MKNLRLQQTRNMRKFHLRCIAYLELIEQSNKALAYQEKKLTQFNAANYMDNIRLFDTEKGIKKQIARFKRLTDWLIGRYEIANTKLQQLNTKHLNLVSLDFIFQDSLTQLQNL